MDELQKAIEAAVEADLAARERVLEYAAEMAIRNRAPVAVYFENWPGNHSLYRFPAGVDA